MKKILRSLFILAISVLLVLISVAYSGPTSTQPSRFSEYTGAAFLYQTTSTPEKTEEDRSEIGSTDGITIMSFVIVLIIVVPILLKRKSWSQL